MYCSKIQYFEIHGFSDASDRAYGYKESQIGSAITRTSFLKTFTQPKPEPISLTYLPYIKNVTDEEDSSKK